MKRNFFASVLMMVLLAACSKPQPTPSPTPTPTPTPTPESSIVFDSGTNTKPTVTETGGSLDIKFTAKEAWTASVINTKADEWITIDKTKGEAGAVTIKATVALNDTPDERNATIQIKAGSETASLVVTQKQKDALTVTAAKNEIEAAGGTFSIEVKANISFTYEIAESCKDWLTYTETKALKISTLNFSVAQNTSEQKREGSVTIKSSLGEEVIKVYQAAAQPAPAITLTKNDYAVKAEGETITVEVKSNVDVAVAIADSAKDWIKASATKAMSTNTYCFDILANEGVESRYGEILFTNTANGLSEKVTVTQMQKDALVVARDSYQIPRIGGGIEIEVGHNVEYTVSIDQDWVANWGVTSTKAYTTDVILFYVSILPDGEPDREATITFTSSDGSIKQEIIVKQGDVKSGLQRLEKYTTLSRDQITAVNFVTGSDKTTSMMTDVDGYPIYGETVGTTVNIYTSADKFLINLNPYVLSVPYTRPEEIKGYFEDCTSLQTLDLRSWDTSISDNMSRTFLNCQSLESVDVSSFDTRNVKSMEYMFSDCNNLSSIDLSNFETPNLKDMSNMFANHYIRMESKLESLDLSNFDTSNLSSTYCMLQLLTNLKELNLKGWKSKLDVVDFMLLSTGLNVNGGMNVYCDQDLAENLIRKASSEPSINWIVPGGFKLYESSDYSMDGKVSILNKATVGNGVNVFLFGDGFADKDIADGTYEAIARQAMEGIFAVEPFKSCRDMFNVYMVDKVSKNNLYLEGAVTAFSAIPSSNESGSLSFESGKIEEEVKKIVGESELYRSTAILFVHHYSNAGAAYLAHGGEPDPANDYAEGFGVGGACLSYFEATLLHEFGHAFAKLDEEYVIYNGGRISEDNINVKTAEQNDFGWWSNIDFTGNLSTIRWADYISDSRYASENIGAYEGAGTFEAGVWRPTEDSVMKSNNGGYNAPSREAIYRRIHKLAYGASWEFDRETFKQWDVQRFESSTKASFGTRQEKRAVKDCHVIRR